jgi:adenylate cyclase
MVDDLFRWIAEVPAVTLDTVMSSVAERLVADGVPLWRVNMTVLAMHPEVAVQTAFWTNDGGCVVREVPHQVGQTARYLASPVAAVIDGEPRVRRRLSGPEAQLDYPVCKDLADQGATDYAAWPLVFTDGRRSAASFCTRAPRGFTEAELARIEAVMPAVALRVELLSAYFATRMLLQAYLGPNAAARVSAGQFVRGSGTSIRAAIWTCDLRGFTALSDQRPPAEVATTLDAYFERVVRPIGSHGGEVLKFIGDAVLAIFPVTGDPADACARALQAAREAVTAMALWNTQRESPLGMGIALHLGEVFYGNVGGPDRLDFTVIGAAVNEVCRLEPLCKSLGVAIVMSEAFRAHMTTELVDLGVHPLRGVAAPTRVFGLDLEDSST